MQSVITGQAPTTLEWKIAPGGNHTIVTEVMCNINFNPLILFPHELSAVSYV